MKRNLFNIPLDVETTASMIQRCIRALDSAERRALTICFINAHYFNLAQKDPKYMGVLSNVDYVLNDGIGIKIAGKMAGIEFSENMNGTDFIPLVIQCGYEKGKTVYLLGGDEKTAKDGPEKLREKHPGIRIHSRDGYFPPEDNGAVIDEINRLGVDILVLGMGAPKQEIWMMENLHRLDGVKIIIAGAAALDFIAGKVSRAPGFFRRINAEWVWRLILEPKRLWRRYLIGNIAFMFTCLKFKWRS